MKIVAIGNTLQDFEICCSNTLGKFIAGGHSVILIIPRDKKWNEKQSKNDDMKEKFSISNLYNVANFDYSKVTQSNVSSISSIIEKVKPSIAIIPFIKSSNKMKKILAKSTLLACRKVETILMYETDKNKNFLPTVYNIVNKKKKQKFSLMNNQKKKITNNNISRKIISLQRLYGNNSGIHQPAEAFESQRMILLQNDVF